MFFFLTSPGSVYYQMIDAWEFLQNAEIDILRWPARSPDLNPIENVWDNMGRQVQQRGMPCRTLQQLENLFPEIWNSLTQEYIQNLFEGLPRRILPVIRARGGNNRF
ncbi:hypothetical protein HHI36_023092 [Cryptolaemus montrouzieri]|uniref:Tc1-like transposase DDE domain-containing protein n=1 Tax=Cryptolaemus montrouzieri TaxID=559131 RepID=A0ABD2PFZ4_9CUCU